VGNLKVKLRRTGRTLSQNDDSYVIQEKDIRRFILENPPTIDLREVDRLWFRDLLANRLVRAA